MRVILKLQIQKIMQVRRQMKARIILRIMKARRVMRYNLRIMLVLKTLQKKQRQTRVQKMQIQKHRAMKTQTKMQMKVQKMQTRGVGTQILKHRTMKMRAQKQEQVKITLEIVVGIGEIESREKKEGKKEKIGEEIC